MSSSKNLTRYQRSTPPPPRPPEWTFADGLLVALLLGIGCYFGAHVAAWLLRLHHA
jgi:hypothetical protein